ncbi:hypothetical protein KKD84_01390 [Patescibacteria group bacterium]|nr:hypothetical protein [Patescibacteria group bacterium]
MTNDQAPNPKQIPMFKIPNIKSRGRLERCLGHWKLVIDHYLGFGI